MITLVRHTHTKLEMTHATFDLNNIYLLKYSKQLSISLLIIIRGWHSAM